MESYFDHPPERAAAFLQEAQSWLRTPFGVRAAVKGVAVDCVCLVAEIMRVCGVVDGYEFPFYTAQYSKHSSESIVLAWLERSPAVRLVPAGEPPRLGDVVCFKVGRCVHHCGVMLNHLDFVHAYMDAGVIRGHLDDPNWGKPTRLWGFYRPIPVS